MSLSPNRIVPSVSSSSPATMRRVVVLPQPEAPSSAKKLPCGTVTERSSTAVIAAEPLGDVLQHEIFCHGYAPITCWNFCSKMRSCASLSAMNTFDVDRTDSSGKISWFSASSGSIFSISSWAPSTGQM